MEVEHSRAFLDCALTGKKITQVNEPYISIFGVPLTLRP
jgi:hypothetical protein